MIKVNGQEIKMEKFPDGTPLFKLEPDGNTIAFIESMVAWFLRT